MYRLSKDTAGQEEYNSVAPIYYKDAAGALIVYDITSKESFQKVKKWVIELEENAPKGIILTIAGNKADLENNRVVKK
jgi:Ras-related protein Rab-5C